MTFPNGGNRDELHPNRKVDRGTYEAKDFPNLTAEALDTANRDLAVFNQDHPLKLRDWGDRTV